MHAMSSVRPAPPPPPPAATPAPRKGGRRFLLFVVLLALAYAGGFVPQWMESRKLSASLEKSELELELANLHRTLGVASHEAQRSNFASAAQAASQFFDRCATLANTPDLEKEARTRVALQAYVGQRDEIMALLSAGDPAARERLASMFLTMEGVMERRGASRIEDAGLRIVKTLAFSSPITRLSSPQSSILNPQSAKRPRSGNGTRPALPA